MRLLVSAFVLVCLASLAASDKEKYAMKKWAIMKAMEGCFGEDAAKNHMIKMKRAVAKCSGMDAPELELPMFNKPYRLVSTLVNPPKETQNNFQKLMEKYLQMKMLQEFREDESPQFYSHPKRMFKRFRRHDNGEEHDHEDEGMMNSLGERLTEKLNMKEEQMKTKVGNMTCLLKELGVVDENMQLDGAGMRKDMKECGIKDAWLLEKLEKSLDNCVAFANNVPNEILDDCQYGRDLTRAYYFKKCMKMSKMRTCMSYDMRTKLEANFGPVDKLVQSTGMKEKDLLLAVHEMLQGPEMPM